MKTSERMEAVVRFSCTPDKSRDLGLIAEACWRRIRNGLKAGENGGTDLEGSGDGRIGKFFAAETAFTIERVDFVHGPPLFLF